MIPLLLLTMGCASLVGVREFVMQEGVTPKREQRRAEAEKHFQQNRDMADFEAARICWEEHNDTQGCREKLEKLLARNPRHRNARLLLAELLLHEENPKAAYEEAKAAVASDPDDAGAHFMMAMVLDALEKTDDALDHYEQAARKDPQNEAFVEAYHVAREAVHATADSAHDPVVRIPESVDEVMAEALPTEHSAPMAPLPPSNAKAGSTPSNGVNDPDDSGDFGDSAGNAQAVTLLQKGQAAFAQGNRLKALECLQQASAKQPHNPQIALSAAATALRANQPEAAVNLLVAATKRLPNNAALHRALGVSYYRSGNYAASQVALQQALSLDKSNALSYLLMGCTLAKLGRREAAEAHLRQARVLDPRYQVVR